MWRIWPRVAKGWILALMWGASPGSSFGAVANYSYDSLNRLTSATIAGSRIEYQYDSAGNITRVVTPYAVLVTKAETGTGSVADSLGKLTCGDDCSGVYDLNTPVTLTAAPEPGSSFAGWSGACSGTGNCELSVTGILAVTATFVVGADLSVTKSDGLTNAAPGGSLSYTIVVSNAGPGAVSDASVSDTLPAGLTCTWTSVAAGGASGSAASGAGSISETLTLPSGSSVTYTVPCEIDLGATGTLSNTATVSSSVPETAPGNESASDTTTLAAAADLSLDKQTSATEVAVGTAVTYTLAVTNNGPSNAQAVSVVDTLPPGVAFQSASGAGWSCNEAAGVVTCDRATLGSAQSAPLEIEVTMPGSAGEVVNQATVSSSTPEAAAGDESDSVSVQVFAPPTIVEVGSVAATETGSVTQDLVTSASITQLYLEASHALFDPAGNDDPHDATNPSCYRLFRALPDATFPNATCADPSEIAIDSASYGVAGPATVALYVNGGAALQKGRYRLRACASGANSLRDAYGSALDGDANGVGGDDFVRDFEVLVTNLLANPNLDSGLSGWTVVSQSPGDVTNDPTSDASDAPTSASARLENLTGAGSLLAMSQCLPVGSGEGYFLGGSIRSEGLGQQFPVVSGRFETFASSDCTGSPLASTLTPLSTGDSATTWIPILEPVGSTASGSASGRVAFEVAGDEASAKAWLDDLHFHSDRVFSDGFESGDTAGWNQSVGVTASLMIAPAESTSRQKSENARGLRMSAGAGSPSEARPRKISRAR